MPSMLRKGKTLLDGTYVYTCGCDYKNPACAYCYGHDLAKCQEAIKTSRGEVYYGLLKTILSHVGKAMVDETKALRAHQNKLSAVDIGYISLKYGLNYKATCEWLEETQMLPAGTHERITEMRDYSVKCIYSEARKKFGLAEPEAK